MHGLRPLLMALLLTLSWPTLANEAADRIALEAATAAWIKAFNSRDRPALAKLMSSDVVLLDSSVPAVSGGEAALTALGQASSAARGQLSTVTKELVVAGDVAWRMGVLVHTQPSGEVIDRGQALEIWKRTREGWRLHRQMSSNLLSRPKLLSRPPLDQPVLDAPRD